MFQRVLLDFVLKTFGLGAENETRTRDPNLGKVVLYQLSYFRILYRTMQISRLRVQMYYNFLFPQFFLRKKSHFSLFNHIMAHKSPLYSCCFL